MLARIASPVHLSLGKLGAGASVTNGSVGYVAGSREILASLSRAKNAHGRPLVHQPPPLRDRTELEFGRGARGGTCGRRNGSEPDLGESYSQYSEKTFQVMFAANFGQP